MNQFTNTPSYSYMFAQNPIVVTIPASDTYVPFDLGEMQIVESSGVGIGQPSGNTFTLGEKAVYWMQFMFTFSGGTNDNYQIAIKNTTSGETYDYTTVAFSIKGNNVWEVQNCFLLNNDYHVNEFFSPNSYQILAQNLSDTSNLTAENFNLVIFKVI